MKNTGEFRDKLCRGQVCLGTCITFNDPTVTEALCDLLDFVWIDTEHNALTLEAVQAHVMATNGSATTPLVRVPWNDPVQIKPVLDVGAAGVIVPLIRSAEDVRRAVAACLYPPQGIRGFGPRRPSNYGRLGGPEFCRAANEDVIVIVQIEHVDAVNDIDAILAVPGLTSVVIGPNDLAGSLGRMGEPEHPEVSAAIETVVARGRQSGVPVGLATGDDPDCLAEWASRGVRWLAMANDVALLLRAPPVLPMESGGEYPLNRESSHPDGVHLAMANSIGNETVRLTMAQALVKYLQVQFSERDGRVRRLIPAIFGIFGHGNVCGLGQALEEYGRDLPYYRPCNEQSMVHTAIGFAKANHRLATLACTSSIGPARPT